MAFAPKLESALDKSVIKSKADGTYGGVGMARTPGSSGGANSDERAHRVYLMEELPLAGEPQSSAIVKVGRSGLVSEEARRACERGNARTLIVQHSTDPLTVVNAMEVEHTVHRWLHAQALQREWFGCPDVAFARQAIDRAVHQLRNPEADLANFSAAIDPAAVPDSPIARTIAALRAHRTQGLGRGEPEKALGYGQQINRLQQRLGHTRLNPTDATAR